LSKYFSPQESWCDVGKKCRARRPRGLCHARPRRPHSFRLIACAAGKVSHARRRDVKL
jgi:hypothetical protein